jgi:hypothetical protein
MQPVIVNGATLGHLGPDGQIIPVEQKTQTTVPPAPEGDELDELLYDCVHAFKTFDDAYGKLAPGLKPQNGAASTQLLFGRSVSGQRLGHDGLKSFITQGTLRSEDELFGLLREYAARQNKRKAIHAISDWMFDNDAMKWLGRKLKAPVDPDPTPEEQAERCAELKAWEAKCEEDRIRHNEEIRQQQEEFKADEAKRLRQQHIKKLLGYIVEKIFTTEDLSFVGENLPDEWYPVRDKRRVFKHFNEGLVTAMIDEGKTDEEIAAEIVEMNCITKGQFQSTVPDNWQEHELRQYFTDLKEAGEYWASSPAGKVATLELAMDGRWCVTIRNKKLIEGAE